jgi:hypothetical protein
MNFQSILDGLHRTVVELGALAFTVLFIVRACLHEIRRMKYEGQKGDKAAK